MAETLLKFCGPEEDKLREWADHLFSRGVDPYLVAELIVALANTECPGLSTDHVLRIVDSQAGIFLASHPGLLKE